MLFSSKIWPKIDEISGILVQVKCVNLWPITVFQNDQSSKQWFWFHDMPRHFFLPRQRLFRKYTWFTLSCCVQVYSDMWPTWFKILFSNCQQKIRFCLDEFGALNRPFVQNSENSQKQNSTHVWNEAKPNASVLEFWTVQTIHRIKLTNIMVFNISKLKIRQNCSVLNLKYTRFQFYFWTEILR